MDSKNNECLYIPEGFAHGFQSLENNSTMLYACTLKRYQKFERGLIWDDNELNINWPNKKKVIISLRDKNNISFKKYKTQNNL